MNIIQVSFNAWTPSVNDLLWQIAYYTIEYQYISLSGGQWVEWKQASIIPSLNATLLYRYNFTDIRIKRKYRFRVSPVPLIDGKPYDRPVIGPTSEEIVVNFEGWVL